MPHQLPITARPVPPGGHRFAGGVPTTHWWFLRAHRKGSSRWKAHKYCGHRRWGLSKRTDEGGCRRAHNARKKSKMTKFKNSHKQSRVAIAAGRNHSSPNPHPGGFRGMFRLNDLAYTKLIVHALKYPHKTVNGLLLGQHSSDGFIDIVDAVPLQHHWTNLSPMMEIGLGMVRLSLLRPLLSVILTQSVFFARDRLTITPVVASKV